MADEDNEEQFNKLPDEVLLKIFGNLSVNSLINIAPVCKRWYELSKDRRLWFNEDAVYDIKYHKSFLRHVRAAKCLRTVDVSQCNSSSKAAQEEVISTLLNGPENVRRFHCFQVAPPIMIVKLLERYRSTLEDMTISISDERLSYGEGGSFKDGVNPRPGVLLKLISEMNNLRIIRFVGASASTDIFQGDVNPKWYFGELENPKLNLQAIVMIIENPRQILLTNFIIPFLRSKRSFLKELHLSPNIWKSEEIHEIVSNCDQLEAIVGFPIECLHALENCKQLRFIDFVFRPWIDFQNIKRLSPHCMSHVHEVSLQFGDQLMVQLRSHFRHVPIGWNNVSDLDTRLETFLPALAKSLKSCKRVHIHRWMGSRSFAESLHSTPALANFLFALEETLEEVFMYDDLPCGARQAQLRKVIKGSVPQLKSRGVVQNRLGVKGCLFSVREKSQSIIPNSNSLL